MPFHKDLTNAATQHPPWVQSATDPGAIGAWRAWLDTGIDGTSTIPVAKVRDSGDAGWLSLGNDQIELIIDGGGLLITTGLKGFKRIPFACTIVGVDVVASDGNSGAVVVDLWVDTYANFPPTVADTITASAKPTITATGTKSQNVTLTGWTKTLAKGSYIGWNVDSVTTFTRVTVTLHVVKS